MTLGRVPGFWRKQACYKYEYNHVLQPRFRFSYTYPFKSMVKHYIYIVIGVLNATTHSYSISNFTRNLPGSPTQLLQRFKGYWRVLKGVLKGSFKTSRCFKRVSRESLNPHPAKTVYLKESSRCFKRIRTSFGGIIKSPPPLDFIFKEIFKMLKHGTHRLLSCALQDESHDHGHMNFVPQNTVLFDVRTRRGCPRGQMAGLPVILLRMLVSCWYVFTSP